MTDETDKKNTEQLDELSTGLLRGYKMKAALSKLYTPPRLRARRDIGIARADKAIDLNKQRARDFKAARKHNAPKAERRAFHQSLTRGTNIKYGRRNAGLSGKVGGDASPLYKAERRQEKGTALAAAAAATGAIYAHEKLKKESVEFIVEGEMKQIHTLVSEKLPRGHVIHGLVLSRSGPNYAVVKTAHTRGEHAAQYHHLRKDKDTGAWKHMFVSSRKLHEGQVWNSTKKGLKTGAKVGAGVGAFGGGAVGAIGGAAVAGPAGAAIGGLAGSAVGAVKGALNGAAIGGAAGAGIGLAKKLTDKEKEEHMDEQNDEIKALAAKMNPNSNWTRYLVNEDKDDKTATGTKMGAATGAMLAAPVGAAAGAIKGTAFRTGGIRQAAKGAAKLGAKGALVGAGIGALVAKSSKQKGHPSDTDHYVKKGGEYGRMAGGIVGGLGARSVGGVVAGTLGGIAAGHVVGSGAGGLYRLMKKESVEKDQNIAKGAKTGAKVGAGLGGAAWGLAGAAHGARLNRMIKGTPKGAGKAGLIGAGIYGAAGALSGGVYGAGLGAGVGAMRKTRSEGFVSSAASKFLGARQARAARYTQAVVNKGRELGVAPHKTGWKPEVRADSLRRASRLLKQESVASNFAKGAAKGSMKLKDLRKYMPSKKSTAIAAGGFAAGVGAEHAAQVHLDKQNGKKS
jgi:hypothetical protein